MENLLIEVFFGNNNDSLQKEIFVSTVIQHAHSMHIQWKIVVVFHRLNSFIFKMSIIVWVLFNSCESISMCAMLTEGYGDFAA